MDPLFLAYSYFRRRKFERCVALCTQVLEKNPYDQVNNTSNAFNDSCPGPSRSTVCIIFNVIWIFEGRP